jgi:hypothetical protein
MIVGWNDSSAHVRSGTDTNGNVYQLAVGPTVLSGSLSQSFYYAKNIAAPTLATNSVTVNFDRAASNPDIRILENSGLDPVSSLDAVAGTSGNSITSKTGAVATTNARDLLLGANMVQTTTAGPGVGSTQRLLTDPDADITEDQIVTATASYTASAPLEAPGGWIMQMVAFRAASGTATPTPTPKPTSTPATPPNSVTLTWNANSPTGNPATTTTGYRVHFGTASGVYTQVTNVGNTTTATVSNLTPGLTYYFAITAYNSASADGPPSQEIAFKVP